MYSFCKKWSQYFKNTPCWNAVLNTRCFDRTAGSWQDISYSAGIDNLMAVSFDKGWAFIVVQCGWRKMCFLDSTLIHFPYLLVYPRIRTLCSHSLYIAWWLFFFLVVVCLWIFIHWWAWFLSYFFWGRDKMSFLFTSHTSPWWLSCYGVALLKHAVLGSIVGRGSHNIMERNVANQIRVLAQKTPEFIYWMTFLLPVISNRCTPSWNLPS